MNANARLGAAFQDLDQRIGALEMNVRAAHSPDLSGLLDETDTIMKDLLNAYGEHAGKRIPASDNLLEIFKAFVKGDPSLNAVRDNVRELVFYRNCLEMGREDALPSRPQRMAVRTLRHVYLYLYSRCEQEHRL
jgi:hypothetical protein